MEQKPIPTSDSPSDMLEEGERVLTVVRRHPIGILAAVGGLGLIILAIGALAAYVGKDVFGDNSLGAISGLILIVAALGSLFLLVYAYIYRQSRLLIADRSLVQITQKSLFIRKMSRLSMTEVEDVSAERRGILSTIFGYGTLVVQTAGEKENFVFPLCPTPEVYADQIIEARQSFMGDDQRSNKTP